MKMALAALIAVFAFSAMAVSSASAFHPLFLTASKQTLLFTGLGVDPLLRGEVAGVVATVLCEKVLIHGFILHNSTLAHLLGLLFEGKCVQHIGSGGAEACKEHITTKPILAELGLLSSTNHTVVILLAPSTGTEFVTLECGSMTTTVSGTIVGEIPETNAKLEKQINEPRESLEIVFATVSKNNQQKITEIFLLGSQMTGQELKVTGLFGGKASEEATATLTSDGIVTICTH